MAFTCAGVRCSTAPRSCFVKPSIEAAPRQVIGFDLSPKAEKSEALPIMNDDDDDVIMKGDPRFKCSNPCLISSEAANSKSNTTTAISPRSALQQLLLRPVDPQLSEPAASSSPVANQKKITNGPLLIQPACKPLATKQSLKGGLLKSTKPYVERGRVPAVQGNYPIFKGIAELVGPSQCARSPINDIGRHSILSAAAVSAVKCVAGIDERSRWLGASIHELPRRSERNGNESSWNIGDQLHEPPPCREKSKKSNWMKELVINIERPHSQHEKSSNVEISRKLANKSIPDQSKKGSLFILGASSPAAEFSTKQYPLQGTHGHYSADHNMDMDFLNSCYLCKRVLGEGHDVFMYSGDKAFCSMECRYQQIVIDERKERSAPPIIRSGASPVYQRNMTTAGAAAVATASAIAITNRPITINRPNFMNPAVAA